MKYVNGQYWSLERFDGYKYRFKIEFETGEEYTHNLDIYTTEIDREKMNEWVESKKTKRVESFKIIHVASKKQDDLTAKFIDETLKDI